MNQKKILHIITRLDQGGSAENTLHSVVELQKKGFLTFLIFGQTCDPTGSILAYLKNNKVTYFEIPSLIRQINPFKDIQAFIAIYLFLKKNTFDIVHTHSSKAGILARWAAWLTGVPHIVHTPHGHVLYGYYSFFISTLFFIIEKITSFITTEIICLTKGEMNDYVKYRLAPKQKLCIIHSGVELDKFMKLPAHSENIKESFGFNIEHRIAGAITRLEKVKGNRFLIKAWKDVCAVFPQARLVIVGEGAEKNLLETLTHNLALNNNIVFAGMRNDIHDIISIIEFLILPSINEGMGKVLIQAAAMGKPSIGSHICGIPDIIKHDYTGLLVEPKNPPALAEAIIHLFQNPDKTHTMGINAFKFVTEPVDGYARFSTAAMIHLLEKCYTQILSQENTV